MKQVILVTVALLFCCGIAHGEDRKAKVVAEKYFISSIPLRYDGEKKAWVPYIPHIQVIKKKLVRIPVFKDIKKRKIE